MKRKKRGSNQHTNNHHLIPEARLRKKEIKLAGITARVDINLHNWLHREFSNSTPTEIFDWFNQTFWGGNYTIDVKEVINASDNAMPPLPRNNSHP